MIRLQTVVSRETPPVETAVLTVGSIQAGSKSNIIPNRAALQLNTRTYSEQTRTSILGAVRRIVVAECQASGCPRDPDFELFDRFPLTTNDAGTTALVTAAFAEFFGDKAGPMGQQTAGEDFSDVPNALGVPYTYWGVGGIDAQTYRNAADAGRTAQDIPVNHSPSSPRADRSTTDRSTGRGRLT